MKIFLIRCSTGCTCCSEDNHFRGPYASQEEAQRRVDFFKKPDAHNNPLASQYASKGVYGIKEMEVEEISGGRIILWEEKVKKFEGFVKVGDDGSVVGEDYFMSELYG